jgi:hypothetical protein
MSLTAELSLVTRLRALRIVCTAFDGLLAFEDRRERVRGAVSQVPDQPYTVRDGQTVTLRQQFERVYGCRLDMGVAR